MNSQQQHGPSMAPPEKDFACSSCAKSFKRAEHLRRHVLIHTQTRPFHCRLCPKDFIRRDALQRHEKTHETAPGLLQRGGRACSNCAAAKVRCSGDVPCSRCQDRTLVCAHPSVGVANPVGHDDPVAPLQTSSPPLSPNPSVAMPPVTAHTDININGGDIDFEFCSINWLDDADFLDFPLPQSPEAAGFFLTAGPSSAITHPAVTSAAAQPTQTVGESQGESIYSQNNLFSPRSAALTDSTTNQTSYEAATAEHGEFYVDGEPSRLPRVKRRKMPSFTTTPLQGSPISTFSLQSEITQAIPESPAIEVTSTTYDHIKALYSELCVAPSPVGWAAFVPGSLPSKDTLEYLVSMYIKHCDQSMPFLHTSFLPDIGNHHCLLLAMAAIGSQYAKSEDTRLLSTSFHEFLRRVYLVQNLSSHGNDMDTGFHDRGATLLHILGMAYSGDTRLQQQALEQQYELAKVYMNAFREAESSQFDVTMEELAWEPWCRREGLIRQAYCAWLVDCMWIYHFDCRPSLGLTDGRLPLPCGNSVWRAGSADDWRSLYDGRQDQATLQGALQQLYVDKQFSQDRGEFARVLIIHGLFHRLWDIERYFANPLSHWEPTASRQSSKDMLPESPIWLPGKQTFMRWQNSTCDCLDVLHWQANAKIGKACGLEHPTVLHLHLARIVLLTPFKDITNLARAMTRATVSASATSASKQLVQRWAIQHQYKARLAVIHAGVVLWHVRRYSIDAFYESPAVALAALVLWAFGTFANRSVLGQAASQPSNSHQLAGKSPTSREDYEQSDEDISTIILLDRPTDDELVQQFIRKGHTMQAHISGVGDLYAVKGPEKVLRQAVKLLSSQCWGVTALWLQLLQDLLDVLHNARNQERQSVSAG